MKWQIKKSALTYEDTVDLKRLLPRNIEYCTIHFTIKDQQLFVYLITTERLPAGETSGGNALYKYDASNSEGLVLVKDLTTSFDPDFIVPTTLVKVGDKIFFKVINSIGGYHDDLWSSDGTTDNTQIVKAFESGHRSSLASRASVFRRFRVP